MYYSGLDIHKRYSQAVIMNEAGRIIREDRIRTDREEIKRYYSKYKGIEVAIESSYGYEVVYEALKEAGAEVRLSHPKKTKAIGYGKVKTDKIDSRILAELLRGRMLPESWVPDKGIRELRRLVRERERLVRERTRHKNRIRQEMWRRGIEGSRKNIWSKRGMEWLKGRGVKSIERGIKIIETIEEQIKEVDKEIRGASKRYEREKKILKSIEGIGEYAASLIIAEIGDIRRFRSAEALVSYAGLCPSVKQSGGKKIYGSITKEGNKRLRWILVECVHIHIKRNERSQVTRYYKRKSRERGKGKAIVAAARKLLRIIYYLLKRGEEYKIK